VAVTNTSTFQDPELPLHINPEETGIAAASGSPERPALVRVAGVVAEGR
jgi:hypothetical protein